MWCVCSAASAVAAIVFVAMAQMDCCCCWYDGRIVSVLKRVQSVHWIGRRRALSTVHRCHSVACLEMFLHRLKLAHNSVLFRQQRTQWPDNLMLIWVQSNSNLRPHRNLLVFGYRWCHCCWCWCSCYYYCYCRQIRIDPPNHRRRGCQDFRAHYCWSWLLLRLLLLLFAHPMPMSFFDATTQPVHIKQ